MRLSLLGVPVGVLAFFAVADTFAQDVPPPSSAGAVQVIEFLDIDAAGRTAALTAYRAYRTESLREDGALAMRAFVEQNRTDRIMIVETWRDQAAYDAHLAAKSARDLSAGLQPTELSVADTRVHRTMIAPRTNVHTLAQARLGAAAMAVMTHLDVPPPFFAALQQPLAAYVEASSQQPGSLSFEVLQHVAPRQNHLTILESWASRSAYDADRLGKASKAFRNTTVPLLGALYDERLYMAVDD